MKPSAQPLRPPRTPGRRQGATRPAGIVLTAVLAAALAACQTPAALDGTPVAGADAADPTQIRSPASERVIGGIVEMVLTSQVYPSFDEAREHRIASVVDGAPLYAWLRANRPLGELAHPADPGGHFAFSDFPHLQIQIGDVESLRIISTCYVTMTGEEARRRELVVPLAPLTYRPGQIPADCWLEAVSASRSGSKVFEVRLAGFPGKFERWLPVPDLMAVAPVATDFRGGAPEYATMLRATPLRSATVVASAAAAGSSLVAVDGGASASSLLPASPSGLSPAAAPAPAGSSLSSAALASSAAASASGAASALSPTPLVATSVVSSPVATVTAGGAAPTLASVAPGAAVAVPVRSPTLVAAQPLLPAPRQEIGNSRMELQLKTLSAAALGRQPSDSWFVERQWSGIGDGRGRVQLQQTHAAAIFRGETCSWQRLVVTRRAGASALSDVMVSGDPIVVDCTDLP